MNLLLGHSRTLLYSVLISDNLLGNKIPRPKNTPICRISTGGNVSIVNIGFKGSIDESCSFYWFINVDPRATLYRQLHFD